MRINFTIPDDPPIEVKLHREPFLGSFTCTANGKVFQLRRLQDLSTHFTWATRHDYRVELGDGKHVIEIEHSRPRFVAGFRPQRYVVKLDGELVADKTGF